MENFEITVDKANEVEIAVYDKQASDPHPQLIGLLWIKINDLVEAQRRQKVMMESGQGGWVTAGAMNGGDAMGAGMQGGPMGDMNAPIPFGDNRVVPPGGPAPGGAQSEGIDAWFNVEPAGALALRLNFSESKHMWHILPSKFLRSQGERPQATAGRRRRSRPSGCCPKAQRRGPRDERAQVRPEAVLPDHSMRFLQRVLAQRCWLPMRRLSVYMSQEVLPKRRHEVYIEVKYRRKWQPTVNH